MNVLGVIGARKGSKAIADKNIRLLLGKPMFVWIAEAAKASSNVSRLIMSTDSEEYAALARANGVEVPFLRPIQLAGDSVPDFDYLYHAALWLKEQENWKADIILRLPPTTPLCLPSHIDACVKALEGDSSASSARTIVRASKHPFKLWRKEGAYVVPFLSEDQTGFKDAHNLPRQQFTEAYQHVDVIALRWNTLVEQKAMAGQKVAFVEIEKHNAIDIDSETDFLLAELLLRQRKENI
jgi:N-acylneuraminate cytidylyltransferase